MSEREATSSPPSADTHALAAEAFVDRARSRFEAEITELYVFGSTVRGETRGLASDVDVLVVLDDSADQKAIADALRDLAYDVMLEYGPVVELHVLSGREFDQFRNEGNPFIENVIDEGRSYA
ncbi:nucleotidyltransferase domain-containing protein [Halomarina halobia]|uniref:Nucleotidyltransferase domain-containing protein n=1 Tax=Halomarina halobia TaxID=3033386 RepID=A0ABD6A9C2_9EURY|nr:nucleotidyltransferase domain-containing protein [Halomarina sp. PSR21]